MRIVHAILTASLLISLTACATPSASSDVRDASVTALVAGPSIDKDHPTTSIRIGGITFHVTKTTIKWDRGGSLLLQNGWGLLELIESPTSVAINLDGAILSDVAK
jgi:hypothetical protein